jgi:hypothetical protein
MTTSRTSPFVFMLAVAALIALGASTLLSVFAWPVVHTAPNKLPVGLVTSQTMRGRLPQLLERSLPGAFAFKPYADEAQARTAILQREVYGAVLLDPARPADFKVLTASAGGPAVAQLLSGVGNQLGTLMAASGFAAPTVEDVVPTTANDPRQATLAAIVLPLVITGYVSGFLLPTRLPRRRERIGATAVVALVAGFSFASIIQFGFQTITGPFLVNGLIFSLAVGAVVALVMGLRVSLGLRGLGVAGGVLMLISNPFSALTSAPEMLPGAWGMVGQLLPLGAFGHMLRSVAFFGGNGAALPLWVLLGWITFGGVLMLLGPRQTSPAPHPAAHVQTAA